MPANAMHNRLPRRASGGGLTRRDLLRALTAIAAGTAVGGSAFGFFYERHQIEITRTSLNVGGLPDGLAGLRVGFLTDLHRSSTVRAELIGSAVQLLMEEKPDLIVLGGDYVTHGERRYIPLVAEDLAPLSAPHGVFAVLGNHDDDRDMPAALASRGIEVLRDARTRLTIRGETLDIIGIRYWTRKLSDLTRLARGAAPATMFVAHTPSRLTEAAQLGLPMMLSGHTHGGQVVLPGLGAVAARHFPIIAGHGSLENTSAFVSRGVGTVYVPIRLNCPPEVVLLTLRPADLS
jgi:predicted MPP superfamily phosphohydrolase